MAVTHALDRHLQNTSQKEIADIIGIDSSTVSHHLSSADDWIDRAVHTSDKYRT
jgi:DNA-binding MarR family transcriptional regulator